MGWVEFGIVLLLVFSSAVLAWLTFFLFDWNRKDDDPFDDFWYGPF